MKRIALFFCSLITFCTASFAADVRQGLVSYWPLDSADFLSNITPDVVGGNNMQLYNIFDSSSLAAGKFGQCFTFDSSLQQCTFFTGDPAVDLGLPATRNPAYSVLLWVKGTGVGQSDLRYFCESAVTTGNNNPLYALGTQTGGTTAGTRIYLRNSTGGVLVDTTTTNAVLDSAWHHIAMIYNNGAFAFYVDGQTTYTNSYTADATGIWDTTSIGGIVRAAFGNFFTGSVDDLGVWARALSKDEIQSVMTSSIQTPVPHFAPAFSVNPSGNSAKLLVGDSFNLKAGVYGTRPMTYQWAKNGTNVDGANSATLSLTNLTASDSGDYTLIASNDQGTSTSGVAKVTISAVSPPNITNALVAYWPLDTVIGSKTPDLVSGYDMTLVNMTAANNVVSGKWGNAMKFDNASHTLLQRVDNPGETLPLYKNPDFSISMWVNGAANQTDRRIWSEGSTTSNNQLFNLGTAHTGADGTLDSYIRTDTGATADHKYTTALVFDDTWHNIVYVQRQAGTAVSSSIYVDGVLDPIALAPMNPLTLNTTTIGGILRSSASSWFSGLIDEVAVWNRALTTDEIQILQSTSITNPPSHLQPLAINGFTSDLPSVVSGGSATLRWDVSKDAGQVKINPLPGDVTAATVVGVGSTNVTLTNSTSFVLSVTRGIDSLSATTSVAVVSGVAPGWAVLDNFDTYNAGPLNQTKWWLDLRGNAVQIGASNANRFMTTLAADSDATLDLNGHTVLENQSATLFFRMTLPAVPDAATPLHLVGLTDKNARSLTDLVTTTGDSVPGGFGPAVYPIVTVDPASGTNAWFLGARNGIGSALDYSPIALEPGGTYDVWLEITNAPMTPDFQSDLFSVYLKKEGDTAPEKIFENYLSDRDPSFVEPVIGGMQPNLDKLVVAGDDAATSAQFDDFYIGTGTISTLPVGLGQSSGPLPPLTVVQSNGQVTITWTAGTLQSASEVSGPWSNVSAGTTSPYSFTPANAHQFFRTTQ